MTVQQLIDELQKVEDKSLEVIATKTYWDWDNEFWDDIATYFEDIQLAEDGSCVYLHEIEY